MCNFSGIFGSGDVLVLQALTAISIGSSILFWIWAYAKSGLKEKLVFFALPIALWVLFGTLDILITAKGTFGDPYREGNQAARFIFIEAGHFGPVVASVMWIALWSSIVLAINRMKMPFSDFVSLSVFYSLSMGHLSGFSSWYLPLCPVARAIAWSKLPMIIGIGIVAAIIHLAAAKVLARKNAIFGGVGASKKR